MPAPKADPAEPTLEEVVVSSQAYHAFVAAFGEEDAQRVLDCGLHHRTRPRLTDPFVDCLVIAVGYDCLTDYHDTHGFEAPGRQILDWIKSNIDIEPYADLGDVMDVFKQKFKEFRGS